MSQIGTFADNAQFYSELGLNIIPCKAGEKKSLVTWKQRQRQPASTAQLDKWAEQHPDANLAVVCGQVSGITVLDDDRNRPIHEVFEEFGKTPIVVKTPNKGYHYYYAHNGERNGPVTGRGIDLKSEGGYVLLPPSKLADSPNIYSHLDEQLYPGFQSDLPIIKGLDNLQSFPIHLKGERNTAMFDHLRSVAKSCLNQEELLQRALLYNEEHMQVPLDEREVRSTVQSVWGYKQSGNLMVPGRQYSLTTLEETLALNPNELWLLSYLRANHKGLRDEFAFSIPAVATKCPAIGTRRIKSGLSGLLQKGYLIKLRNGGRGVGDVPLFKFTYLV